MSQEFPSLAIKKINASGQVLKTFDIYFNLTNDDIVFSLLDSAYSFNFLIGAVNETTLSGSGLNINIKTTISGAVNCGSSNATETVPCSYLNATGAFTSANVNCTTLNSFNLNCTNLNTTGNVGTGTNVRYTNLHVMYHTQTYISWNRKPTSHP
jgi:hypothetical protein